MIEIVTDSCADLSPDLLEQFHIRTIPLQVFINGTNFADGELKIQQLFDLVSKTGELPKTSAPAVSSFFDFFNTDDPIIYIGLSSRLSATMQNSMLAADQLPGKDITTIDSLNLSTGIGHLVVLAAELRDQGCSKEEIVAQVKNAVSKVHSSFVIDTLDYLWKGGRCSSMQAIVGSLLSIRPVIAVLPEGTMTVKEKIRGSRKKALNSLLEDFRKNLAEINPHRVFITHTGCDADAEYLCEELLKIAPLENVNITYAGATIGSHCGPNTIGILYMTR